MYIQGFLFATVFLLERTSELENDIRVCGNLDFQRRYI